MSAADCAQRCLDDAGCLSFDAGVIGLWQEGDCFLSYDNRQTNGPSQFLSVSQLDYYEKIGAGKQHKGHALKVIRHD
jgi:hypothetical protein